MVRVYDKVNYNDRNQEILRTDQNITLFETYLFCLGQFEDFTYTTDKDK